MSDSDAKSEIKSLLISGVGVAAVSVTGYILAFNYEMGYANFFGIPIRFIKLNLITIFIAVLGLISVFLFIMGCISIVYPFLPKKISSPIYRKLLGLSPFFLIYLGLFIIYGPTWWFYSSVKYTLILFTLLVFFDFVWPLLTQREKGTYFEKLEAQESLEHHNQPRTFIGFITSTPKGLRGLRLVFSLLLLLAFAYCIGNSEAIRKKHFLVLKDRKNTVVLRIYDDKYICAPFNRETKQVDRSLIILESSGQNELILNWQKVGPLKLVDIRDE